MLRIMIRGMVQRKLSFGMAGKMQVCIMRGSGVMRVMDGICVVI